MPSDVPSASVVLFFFFVFLDGGGGGGGLRSFNKRLCVTNKSAVVEHKTEYFRGRKLSEDVRK